MPDVNARSSTIVELVKGGVNFLYENQLPWGEIANYSFLDNPQSKRTFRSTVFPTALVLHSLRHLNDSEKLETVKSRAIEFVLRNKENGYWKYFGIGSEYPADMDTTACCLSALWEFGIIRDASVTERLLCQRDESRKLFHTWVSNSPTFENDCDSAVNANVLWLYALLNRSDLIKEVVDWVVQESRDLHTQNSQRWYSSPQIYCYFVSRVLTTGNVCGILSARDSIIRYLKFIQDENGGWGNSLETAFAVVALIDSGVHDASVDRGVNYLIESVDSDNGCWPMEFLYPFGGAGSEEITTGVCLEALSKYMR